jgi:hypothetical protein
MMKFVIYIGHLVLSWTCSSGGETRQAYRILGVGACWKAAA